LPALALLAAASLAAQAQQPAPPGEVIGVGNFAHIVADLDKTLGFYRDAIGLEITVQQGFAPNDAIAKLGATEGGQSRIAVLDVPGLELGVELIEYKDIQRNVQRPRFYDPGAANLALRMRDIDAVYERVAKFPGAKVITAGGKPVTIKTPNGELHAVFVQDPDGFVVELAEIGGAIAADAPAGNIVGGAFEPTVANSEASIKFYNELLGFNFPAPAAWNDNQQMAGTAGAPGASFRQSRTNIPGTSVAFTFIEWRNIDGKMLTGRTQDPGTTVLQLIVRDVAALTAKLKAAGVPIVTTGGAPVEVVPGLNISIVRDPSNVLLELVQRSPR
ncbi:MAG TPA: VOC family protein, partial [Gammaproteobacteria bacterium]|nr:VOC family protein [Gammaproteobacteria bacterium]